MRTLRLSLRLLILPFCLVGCASTTGVSSKIRTVATIGDKPLPVVTGEPGATVVTDRVAPERRANPEGRISGRVVDEEGHPVSDVWVRLAVSNAPGGKVVRATTDRSGAFTLRGLRPGSSYTVIAEREDERGLLTGRSEARALRPPFGSPSSTPTPTRAGRAASKSARVNAISNRESSEEEPDALEASSPINMEDLPPAPEAEALAPASNRRTASPARDNAPPRTAGWRRGESERSAAARSKHSSAGMAPPLEESVPGPVDRETHGTSAAPEESSPQDDGPNPLPPALEGDRASSPKPAAAREETQTLAQAPPPNTPPEDAQAPDALPSPTALPEVAKVLPQVPLPKETKAPTQAPPEEPRALAQAPRPEKTTAGPQTAPSLEVTPEEAKILAEMMQNSDAREISWSNGPFRSSEPARPEPVSSPPGILVAVSEALPSAESQPVPHAPVEVTSPNAGPRRRPTWRELTLTSPTFSSLDEAQLVSHADAEVPRGLPRRVAPPPDDGKTYCHYDSRHRRLEDFRLPDLQGRLVRFQDLDADLILLDFWGTWCEPCVKSVPHLVDLQTRLGAARLKVVGIACEQGPPKRRRRTSSRRSNG